MGPCMQLCTRTPHATTQDFARTTPESGKWWIGLREDTSRQCPSLGSTNKRCMANSAVEDVMALMGQYMLEAST